MKPIDLTGQKFGRLTAVERATRRQVWIFRCDCGKQVEARNSDVTSGKQVSCGCYSAEKVRERSMTHGHAARSEKHPLYSLWAGMIARCEDPNHVGYGSYGGRGIKVCDRWKSFENFLIDMAPRPRGQTLDRRDTDGDYSPSNCQWSTTRDQAENTRRNIYLELNGERLTVSQWSRRLGIDQRTLNRRRYLGWSDRDVLTKPIRSR